MKTIKINSVVTNSENETTNIESLARLDIDTKTIYYKEEELDVEIKILDNKILMKRHNDDYDLSLIFELGVTNKCKYEVKSIGLDLNIDVYTKKLEIKDNYIYAHYDLSNEEKPMGTFEFKIMFWE